MRRYWIALLFGAVGIGLVAVALMAEASKLPSGRPAAVCLALLFCAVGPAVAIDHRRHPLWHGGVICVIFSLISALLLFIGFDAPPEATGGGLPFLPDSWNYAGGQWFAIIAGALLGLASLVGWSKWLRALVTGDTDWK